MFRQPGPPGAVEATGEGRVLKEDGMDRSEHMTWCKERALEYVDQGDVVQALTSMCSDLGKHEDTRGHSGIELGMMLTMTGSLNTTTEMRRFIEGFN